MSGIKSYTAVLCKHEKPSVARSCARLGSALCVAWHKEWTWTILVPILASEMYMHVHDLQ